MKHSFLHTLFNISIFTPTSKVHVQRDVMFEVDARLAKYSQRGIFLSLIIFTLGIFTGEYYLNNPKMTLMLAGGLVFITFARAYFLLRFDQLYAQGPARWRQRFFYFSLLGSSWWGFIVANITWVNGLDHETPIFWLYTVAFFAGSIYVFAPFQRFLKLYMFVSFVPCAVVAIYLFTPTSIIYGCIMVALYLLLCRQGRIIGQNYWDKLQATYDLLKRANTLEAEKITTKSSLDSRDKMYANLNHELKSSIQEIVGSLQLLKDSKLEDEDEQLVLLAEYKAQQQISLLKNVAELSVITSKSLSLEQQVIDPRFHIEQALNHVAMLAHKMNVELYSCFSEDVPLRVRGDAERIEQIVENLISSACQFCDSGNLLINTHFYDDDAIGTLNICVENKTPLNTPEAIESINHVFSPHYAADINVGLNLAMVKGLAQCMGGDASVEYQEDGSLIFRVSISLESVSSGLTTDKSLLKLSGKTVLLYQAPELILETFIQTLEAWGLTVKQANDEDSALGLLDKNQIDNQLVFIYTYLDDISALSFSRRLAEHDEFKAIPQIVTLSKLQNTLDDIEKHFAQYDHVDFLYKPMQYRRLKKMMKGLLLHDTKKAEDFEHKHFLTGKNLLLFQKEDIDIAIIKAMLKKLGCVISTATTIDQCLKLLKKRAFDAFICESHLDSIDLQAFVKQAREANDCLHNNAYKMPVLGLTSHELEGEETHCLAAGMEYYIDSPTNIDDLHAILRRFIGRSVHMAEALTQKNTSK